MSLVTMEIYWGSEENFSGRLKEPVRSPRRSLTICNRNFKACTGEAYWMELIHQYKNIDTLTILCFFLD